ncbi:MAG: hypothetical protein V7631_4243 [Massilia sp.]
MSRIQNFLAMALLGISLSGCSGGGGGGDAVVVVPPPARASLPLALMATVGDAATRAPLSLAGTEKVTVAVYGADADKVVDGEGKSLYNATAKLAGPLTSSEGLFTLYLKPPTGTFSLNLRVVASAPNYVTSSQDMVLTQADLNGDGSVKTIEVPINLISLAPSAQPESVVSTKVTGTLSSSGATTAPIAATTPSATATTVVNGVTTTVSLGTANASLPTAVIAYADEKKTIPLPAGPVSVDVVYNNNTTSDSLATFPGGMITRQDPAGQALSSPGSFISGGFASIEVSTKAADGTVTKAKTFDKPISVTISLPKGTINPETGAPVKAGEIIPIWSYDTTTGEWTVMKMTSTGAIITGQLGALRADDTFPVTFTTDHLSYFNLDWFAWRDGVAGGSKVPQCDTAPITIKGAAGRPLYLEAVLAGGGWMHPWNLYAGDRDPAQDKITYAPKGLSMIVNAYYNTNRADATKLVGSVAVGDICAGVTLDVTAGMAKVGSIATAALDVLVREVCSSDTTKASPVPSDTITAVTPGLPVVTMGTSASGVATLKGLYVGKTYALTVKNRDEQVSKLSVIVQAVNPARTVDFSVSCKTVTGVTGGSSNN